MAKKGSSKGAVSQGLYSNVSKATKKAARRAYIASGERIANQLAAWKKGRNVVFTIPNPNPNQTNKRFVRVNALDIKGKAR